MDINLKVIIKFDKFIKQRSKQLSKSVAKLKKIKTFLQWYSRFLSRHLFFFDTSPQISHILSESYPEEPKIYFKNIKQSEENSFSALQISITNETALLV